MMERINVDEVLAPLKGFQRRTVDYVFRRLYLDDPPARRFLVADEVGLGKTLVGRGLVARVIDHLWTQNQRIDIVYICSNGNIARQNIRKLNVTTQAEFTLAQRVTLLPSRSKSLQSQRVNFLSLTPGTSFDLKSQMGIVEERVLIYHMLRAVGRWVDDDAAILDIFRGEAAYSNFEKYLDWYRPPEMDPGLLQAFAQKIMRHDEQARAQGRRGLDEDWATLLAGVRQSPRGQGLPELVRGARTRFLGQLRSLLAEVCIHAIEPDLIIMDEFQRFKTLLADESSAGNLAHSLFNFADEQSSSRVVLLSATPYKMYTLGHESDDDHYADFYRTIKFLVADDPERQAHVRKLIQEFRRHLIRFDGTITPQLEQTKHALEGELRQVMVRTERLAASKDRSGMLQTVQVAEHYLAANELVAYRALQQVATSLRYPDIVDLWKSAPYLLNFMEEYQLKTSLWQRLNSDRRDEVAQILRNSGPLLLDAETIETYAALDPQNARLRALERDMVGSGLWQLLWLPPALPYYSLQGPFSAAHARSATKRLVFSSWRVVPKVIATLLSYAAERHIVADATETAAVNTSESRQRRGNLLRPALSEGRPATMSLLTLLYPSMALAQAGDPLLSLTASLAENGTVPAHDDVLLEVDAKIQNIHLRALRRYVDPTSTRDDERWYWAAPILLDLHQKHDLIQAWFAQSGLAQKWQGNDVDLAGDEDGRAASSVWEQHVAAAQRLAAAPPTLGRMPQDLSWTLTLMALAGPGVVALRALARSADDYINRLSNPDIRLAAAQVGWAFRSFFNLPEATALIRSRTISDQMEIDERTPYWERVLVYCLGGCLQSVLDEHVHGLRESLGVVSTETATATKTIADEICAALTIRSATAGVDVIDVAPREPILTSNGLRMRQHFAMRFGDERSADNRGEVRAEQVRQAFNSPFWPFILATTSIGQEGLDFHTYCHAVVHWNLPSNPIDLEQREGRVHRYKGHAVRKNVALRNAQQLANSPTKDGDPWVTLFAAAEDGSDSDVSPYWVYPVADQDGGVSIQRHILALPWSREARLIHDLQRSLAAYRMVFGQPRQEDLLAFLTKDLGEAQLEEIARKLTVNLEPPCGGLVTGIEPSIKPDETSRESGKTADSITGDRPH